MRTFRSAGREGRPGAGCPGWRPQWRGWRRQTRWTLDKRRLRVKRVRKTRRISFV
ncbi:hypothetical protein ASZ90_001261 [hydrocarbon metagenome]|uniref:Uncharacterized protein n=1 Tax=hydrocarbon metagenome TaxID=938273 RepID=A0A0W8G8Q3_9ZZZZ